MIKNLVLTGFDSNKIDTKCDMLFIALEEEIVI